MKIRLSKCSISDAEINAVTKVLQSEYLGMGTTVADFESAIKDYLKTTMEVVCVNSGTAALHLSLSALGLKEGDEVLVPSLTYVASFQAISATGAMPVSCDVTSETVFIDVGDAEKKITANTKAIMPVHYGSSPKGISDVYRLAKKYNLRVIEDAAQSFGSEYAGKKVGVEGDIVCFSFDGIKNITSGEGGAIISSDLELVRLVRDSRLLGVEKDTEKRFKGLRSWDFDVVEQGYRYHMSNIMAAIGIAQIGRVHDFKKRRQGIVASYINGIADINEVTLLEFDYEKIMPHIFVVKVQRRDELKAFLENNNIECGLQYKPNHMLSKYATSEALPQSEVLYSQLISLPCHYDLTVDDVNFICCKVREFYEG